MRRWLTSVVLLALGCGPAPEGWTTEKAAVVPGRPAAAERVDAPTPAKERLGTRARASPVEGIPSDHEPPDPPPPIPVPEAVVRGRLVDVSGHPVLGTVFVWTPGSSDLATVGEDGSFAASLEAEHAASGGYRVVAWGHGWAARVGPWRELVRAGSTDAGDFALEPAAPLYGAVEDDDPPSDGVTVHVDASSAFSPEDWAVLDACDADEVTEVRGPFTADHLPAGTYRVWTHGNDAVEATAGEYLRLPAQRISHGPPPPPEAEPPQPDGPLLSVTGRVLLGREPVVWSARTVVSGLRHLVAHTGVRMKLDLVRTDPSRDGGGATLTRSALTSADGSFAFGDLPEGEYAGWVSVDLTREDDPPAGASFRVRAGAAPLDVVLHRTVRRTIEVLADPASGRITHLSASCRAADVRYDASWTAVQEGSVGLQWLDPERAYIVEIDGGGSLAPRRLGPALPADLPASVRLEPGLEITGRVVTADGAAVPFASVDTQLPGWVSARDAYADLEGRFVIRGLPAADAVLSAGSAAWCTADDLRVPGGTTGVVLVLGDTR